MTTLASPAATDDSLAGSQPHARAHGVKARLDAVDMLRGLVIVLMVLDHVRDFFHVDAFRFSPTDPLKTTAILFATRWVTHLCAPTFVFLAGVSILFQKADGKPPAMLSAYLLKRGLWLVLLEITVVSFGFNFAAPFFVLQVIWAIGVGMIAMSVISRAPARVVLTLGVAIMALHPLAASLTSGATGALGVLRTLLLAPNITPSGLVGDLPVPVMYPVLPWLAVMCLGFGLGPIFRLEPLARRRRVLAVALVMLAQFLLLRGFNLQGDPTAWAHLDTPLRTVMSFLDLSKYPPSPDYVLATLGVSLLLFLALERLQGPAARMLLAFGRTPLFTYVCHLYLAHGLMLASALAFGFPAAVATNFVAGNAAVRLGWGVPLWAAYGVWIVVVLALYPLASWFAEVKRRRRDGWLSYL